MYNIGWLGHGIQHFVVDGSVHLWNLTAGNRFQTIPNQFFEGPAFMFPIVHADFDDSWCFLLWFSYRVVCIQAPRPAGILIFVFSGTPRGLKSFPGNSLWPFWDGDPWPFRKVVGDLQRLGINRSRLESPGQYNFLSMSPFFPRNVWWNAKKGSKHTPEKRMTFVLLTSTSTHWIYEILSG